jgi:hypothetical protein
MAVFGRVRSSMLRLGGQARVGGSFHSTAGLLGMEEFFAPIYGTGDDGKYVRQPAGEH